MSNEDTSKAVPSLHSRDRRDLIYQKLAQGKSTDEAETHIARHSRYSGRQENSLHKKEPEGKVKLTILSLRLSRIAGSIGPMHFDLAFHIHLA